MVGIFDHANSLRFRMEDGFPAFTLLLSTAFSPVSHPISPGMVMRGGIYGMIVLLINWSVI